MAGGFLKGAILGGVLSVAAAVVISVLVPLPSPPDVADIAPESQVQISVLEATDLAETPSVADTAPETTETTQTVEAPQPDPVPAVEETLTRASVPEPVEAAELDAPEVVTAEAIPTPDPEAPVLPTPQALAPMLPEPSDDVTVNTAPADAPTPLETAPETQTAEADTSDQTTLPGAETTAQADAPQPLPETRAETVVAEPETAEAPVIEEIVVADVEPAPEVPTDDAPAEVPLQEDTLTDTQEAVTDKTAEDDGQTVVASIQIGTGTERLQSSDPSAASRLQIGKPGVSLVDRTARIKINRATSLPTISGTANTEAGDSVQSAPAGLLESPIHANAQPFENEDDRPLMSIVLIDEGESLEGAELGFSALKSFPYPLSIAVSSSLPDAEERMAKYRENGFEVLAMIDLPEGAAPTDAEVTLGVTLDRMGDVVAVLEGTGSGLQGTRDVSDQVTEILLQSGHGLVSQSQGLNTAPKLARKAGVPARPVFRDFDGNGQDARVIRRFLDQAAFKARQEGGVIMQGRLRSETIKALLVWGLAERASQVALAPVSAVLLTQ